MRLNSFNSLPRHTSVMDVLALKKSQDVRKASHGFAMLHCHALLPCIQTFESMIGATTCLQQRKTPKQLLFVILTYSGTSEASKCAIT